MKKLLIVDDDPIITSVYGRRFRAEGFEVRIASSGEEGLLALHDFIPDAVLLDLNMPDGSGVDWLAEVRGDPRFANLPVLVFTAGTLDWQVWTANYLGLAFKFKKGAVPADVVDAVHAVIAASATPPGAGRAVVRVFGHAPRHR